LLGVVCVKDFPGLYIMAGSVVWVYVLFEILS
jgi:hypothetical protein